MSFSRICWKKLWMSALLLMHPCYMKISFSIMSIPDRLASRFLPVWQKLLNNGRLGWQMSMKLSIGLSRLSKNISIWFLSIMNLLIRWKAMPVFVWGTTSTIKPLPYIPASTLPHVNSSIVSSWLFFVYIVVVTSRLLNCCRSCRVRRATRLTKRL